MTALQEGSQIDGFTLGSCIHAGSRASIYEVRRGPPGGAVSHVPLIMKVPHQAAGEGAADIVSFEVESQILEALRGLHVPHFVAAGDLARQPYLVMERVHGHTLQQTLDAGASLTVEEIARLGAAMAHAVHAVHQQNAVHLDLKPANILVRDDGNAVLLDFGLSCHAHFPDLLAEQAHRALGTPAWIAPEQLFGVRGDPRSDLFALGVILYQLSTGELPFGAPRTDKGMRERLWMDPRPPRKLRKEIPPWLQEIILRCLEPEAAKRYPSAALLAFDLTNPDQIRITARGNNLSGTGFITRFRRRLKASGFHYLPSPVVSQQISEVPIVMVAVAHQDVREDTLYSLRQAAARSLGTRPGARLACVTVISPAEASIQRRTLTALQLWATPLESSTHQMSFHVLVSHDVAQALLDYASANDVSVMVLGAATHGVKTQRLFATVPIKVAMNAPCTVILVKQTHDSERNKSNALGESNA